MCGEKPRQDFQVHCLLKKMMRQIFTIGTCLLRGGGSSRSFWKPMDEGCFYHDLHPDSIH